MQVTASYNKPSVVSAAAFSATVQVLTAPSGPGLGLLDPNSPLVLNDAATLAGANSGNEVLRMPLSAFVAGVTFQVANDTGFVISQMPPGVSLGVLR